MNWFTNFVKDSLTAIFGDELAAKTQEKPKTYNETQVKAGIMYVLDSISKNDKRDNRDEYADVFRAVRIAPTMTVDDIEEQMSLMLDKLLENDLITAEEFENLDYNAMVAAMADIAITAIEKESLGHLALKSIRFEQQLRKPVLRVVRNETPDCE